MKKIIALFILIPMTLFAEDKNWQFSTGILYNSARLYRGALIWPAPSIMPLLGVSYKNLALNGPGFTYNIPSKKTNISFGLAYFNDGPPLIPLKNHHKDFRNERAGVYDGFFNINYEFIPRFKLNWLNSKAINTHYGFYSAASIQIPLIPFFSFTYLMAYADGKNNRYVYGPEARAGLAHHDFSINLFLPFLPWKGILTTKYTLSRIALDTNKNAHYVRATDKPQVVTSMCLWSF